MPSPICSWYRQWSRVDSFSLAAAVKRGTAGRGELLAGARERCVKDDQITASASNRQREARHPRADALYYTNHCASSQFSRGILVFAGHRALFGRCGGGGRICNRARPLARSAGRLEGCVSNVSTRICELLIDPERRCVPSRCGRQSHSPLEVSTTSMPATLKF